MAVIACTISILQARKLSIQVSLNSSCSLRRKANLHAAYTILCTAKSLETCSEHCFSLQEKTNASSSFRLLSRSSRQFIEHSPIGVSQIIPKLSDHIEQITRLPQQLRAHSSPLLRKCLLHVRQIKTMLGRGVPTNLHVMLVFYFYYPLLVR